MKIAVFQGNPGKEYAKTRHNTGFLAADFLVKKWGLKWKTDSKFKAEKAEMPAEKVLLVKPQGFYNLTGEIVNKLVQFYKLDANQDLLVVCDDLNLPFGTVRTRQNGSDGGNNGLKSIIAVVGKDFKRVRIGTYNNSRDKLGDVDFVLSKFSKEEQDKLPEIWQKVETAVTDFIQDSFKARNSV